MCPDSGPVQRSARCKLEVAVNRFEAVPIDTMQRWTCCRHAGYARMRGRRYDVAGTPGRTRILEDPYSSRGGRCVGAYRDDVDVVARRPISVSASGSPRSTVQSQRPGGRPVSTRVVILERTGAIARRLSHPEELDTARGTAPTPRRGRRGSLAVLGEHADRVPPPGRSSIEPTTTAREAAHRAPPATRSRRFRQHAIRSISASMTSPGFR
jgi:hypothetical protein